jgi:hypothetical protein
VRPEGDKEDSEGCERSLLAKCILGLGMVVFVSRTVVLSHGELSSLQGMSLIIKLIKFY